MHPSRANRHVEHLELVQQTLLQFGSVRFRAQGSSMLPAIFPGDCIVVESFGSREPAVGEIVLSRRQQNFLVHRIVRIDSIDSDTQFVLRGDALTSDDPPLTRAQLLGRVTALVRGDKLIALSGSQRSSLYRLSCFLVRHFALVRTLLLHGRRIRSHLSRTPQSSRAYSPSTYAEWLT